MVVSTGRDFYTSIASALALVSTKRTPRRARGSRMSQSTNSPLIRLRQLWYALLCLKDRVLIVTIFLLLSVYCPFRSRVTTSCLLQVVPQFYAATCTTHLRVS